MDQNYPREHNSPIMRARMAQESGYRPQLKTKLENPDSYGVIFLGYPNWRRTVVMAVYTFLESYDFYGKKIVPFCTHEGSGMGSSKRDIKRLCPSSTVEAALPSPEAAAAAQKTI